MSVIMTTSEQAKIPHEPYGYPSTFCVVDGIIQLPGMTKEFMSYLKELPVKDGDVFVATYQKSGTTWMSEIVWQIFLNGKIDKNPIGNRVLFMEGDFVEPMPSAREKLFEFYLSRPRPRVFKTHLAHHQVPIGETGSNKAKHIYVARNPKDVAVSYYYNMKYFNYYEFNGSWDEYFELFIDGKIPRGHWFDHVLGWWAHRDDPNILFLKYEDMKKNLPDAVQQTAKFLDKDLSPEIIQRIAEQTTFAAMSDGKGRFFDGDEDIEKAFKSRGKFLRKGEIGDWRNYFTEDQNQRFDELYKARMAGSGLEMEFD